MKSTSILSERNVSDTMIKLTSPRQYEITQKEKVDFEIQFFSWLKEERSCYEGDLQRLNCYEILWIKRGSGLLTVNLKDYSIADHQVYILRPGMLREIHSASVIDGFYLSLTANFFSTTCTDLSFSFMKANYKNPTDPIVIEMNDVIRQEMEEVLISMRREFVNYYSLRLEIMKGLFKIFLMYLSRKLVIKDCLPISNRSSILVNDFTILLNEHFACEKTVGFYASQLCVTRHYLNQVVKNVSGCTANQYIQQHIVLEAKRLAIHSSKSMKEIAYVLGFDDTSHFSKFFKNCSGINFTNFKKNMLG